MSLTYVTHSQRRRIGMLLFALVILGLWLATSLLFSRKSRESLGIDRLYGLSELSAHSVARHLCKCGPAFVVQPTLKAHLKRNLQPIAFLRTSVV
jgi:hypothetical protein